MFFKYYTILYHIVWEAVYVVDDVQEGNHIMDLTANRVNIVKEVVCKYIFILLD